MAIDLYEKLRRDHIASLETQLAAKRAEVASAPTEVARDRLHADIAQLEEKHVAALLTMCIRTTRTWYE